jgi:hypothetical protein
MGGFAKDMIQEEELYSRTDYVWKKERTVIQCYVTPAILGGLMKTRKST